MSFWRNIWSRMFGAPAPASAIRMVPSATPRFAGIQALDDLAGGADWATTADEMARTEPKLRACEDRVLSALNEALLIWRAGRDTPEARKYADHLNLGCGVGVDSNGSPIRSGYMRSDFGRMVQRMGAGLIRYGWSTIDVGSPRRQPNGLQYPFAWWEIDATGLAPNPWVEATETMVAGDRHWWVDVLPGDLAGIRILQSATGETGILEPHRTLYARFDDRAADWEGGHGLYRSCHFWWKLSSLVSELIGIAAERFGTGVPVVREDRRAAHDLDISPDDLKSTVSNLLEVAGQWKAGHQTALVHTDGAHIEILDTGFDPSKLVAVQQHCTEQMRAAFLLSVLDLGTNGTGAYNLGQVLSQAFTALVGRIARRIEATMNGLEPFQGALYRSLAESYGPIDVADRPRLCIEGLVEVPFSDHMAHLVNMLSLGAPSLHPEAWARVASATQFDRRDIEVIAEEARRMKAVKADEDAQAEARKQFTMPTIPNNDPGAGGLPTSPQRTMRLVDAHGEAA